MTPLATLSLVSSQLQLRCPEGDVWEDRPLDDSVRERFEDWSRRHLELAETRDDDLTAAALLALGGEMARWLDGGSGNLTRVLEAGNAPVIVELRVGKLDPSPEARAFLDAPWELLAWQGQHLALSADTGLTVIRRLGPAQEPPGPSAHRLGVVFMAAAPRGADNLDWEGEEVAILEATQSMGLDLLVEESGTLGLLAAAVAREKPEVVQISCHGSLEPEPGLYLETEVGDGDFVTGSTLIQRLAEHQPRLIFLSACETAESHPVLDALAQSMARGGAPAVLGWAAPVLDREAALFAAGLLRRLSDGADLARAFGYARLELARHPGLPENPGGGPVSRDWHLARLYFSPKGGGVLATAGGPRRLTGQGHAVKTFLDVKGQRVPVAGEREFVGRRREIQTILREFRGKNHAGVLIHGMGRQGKSSLAARVARRLEHSHEVLVLFDGYRAVDVLRLFHERLGHLPEVARLVTDFLPRVEGDPAQLLPALSALLRGPCRQRENHARPVLLIVDDFERVLEPQPDGPHQLLSTQPALVPAIRALITAFQQADTDSRLLLTSRFQFTLPGQGGAEMTARLLDVPLSGMNDRESRKQILARLRQSTALTARQRGNLPALVQNLSRITAAAQGNPGLQDLLHSLCLDDPAACDTCLGQMEAYRTTGTAPDAEGLRQFLENLAIGSLIGLLNPPARELLRASTLFELPVPVPVLQRLAPAVGADGQALSRLTALGLWETYEDLHDPLQPALAINALARPLSGSLSAEEAARVATAASPVLLDVWGGPEGSRARGSLQDHELTRLGLLARDAGVLTACAADALRFLENQFEYRRAAAWAAEIVEILESAGATAPVDLLRTAAERLVQVGDVAAANTLLAQLITRLDSGEITEGVHHAATLITYARSLVEQGRPGEALKRFQQAEALLPAGREKAVVMGEIARLLASRGEVDRALALHEERLAVYEDLGDKRERAITLGDIARLLASRGEVARALALHEEALAVYEELGDKRSRAVTLGDIARLLADRGEVARALALHEEMLTIFEELGEKRPRAITLGDIARLLADRGEVARALALHEEMLTIFEELGEKRPRAITLGDIARLLASRGEVARALALHEEALAVYEELGDKRSRAVTLGDIARLLADRGEVARALALHEERLAGYEELGEKRSRAVTLGDIARLLADRGEVAKALELHEERLAIFEDLGDKRERAITLGDIARLLADRGEVDKALQLHEEILAVYEELGDKRSRAVTLGDIARLQASRGEADRALELQSERLEVNQGLGDQDGIAAASFDLAKLELQQQRWQDAFDHLNTSYAILLQLGRLDGICFVGHSLGQLLCAAGQREEGLAMLRRSLDGFQKLGRLREVEVVRKILEELS